MYYLFIYSVYNSFRGYCSFVFIHWSFSTLYTPRKNRKEYIFTGVLIFVHIPSYSGVSETQLY